MTLPVGGTRTPSTPFFPQWIERAWNATAAFAVKAFKEIAQVAQDIKDNPNSVVKALKITVFSTMLARQLTNNPAIAESFTSRVAKANGLVDVFNTVPDANYFVSGAYKKDNIADNIANGIFLGADIAGIGFWLEDLQLPLLGKISELVGKIPVLNQIPFSLSQAVTGAVGAAFAFLGVGAVIKLAQAYKGDKNIDKTQAWLDLAWAVVEVVSKTFILLGLAQIAIFGTFGLVGLGIAGSALGIASSVYGSYAERAKQQRFDAENRAHAVQVRQHDQQLADNYAQQHAA